MDNMAFCLQALYINGNFVNVCFCVLFFFDFCFFTECGGDGGGCCYPHGAWKCPDDYESPDALTMDTKRSDPCWK